MVEIGKENVEISLRETAIESLIMKEETTYCKCRKLCHIFTCRKQNVSCHSRCHGGTACTNNQVPYDQTLFIDRFKIFYLTTVAALEVIFSQIPVR